MSFISGYATKEGTERFLKRLPQTVLPHFHLSRDLTLSDLGMGTYLGNCDEPTDERYTQAVYDAVTKGVNVLDTAINYRFMRSERSIGEALRRLIQDGKAKRDEVVVATKGGYLSFDGSPPEDPAEYFSATYFRKGIIQPSDIVEGSHCMEPRFIEHEIEKSLKNLGLETIDIYYLHNVEYQLNEVDGDTFARRLLEAFRTLEVAVTNRKIRRYGLATWDGFRSPAGTPNHLSLEGILMLAKEAGGENHHFEVVQLPFNFLFREAAMIPVEGNGDEGRSFLALAQENKLMVMASVPLFQGRLLGRLPDTFRRHFGTVFKTDAQRALAFVSSAPGITSALCGMSSTAHVAENTSCLSMPRLSKEVWNTILDQIV